MSEKMTDGMTEAQRRAEKIKAIRRSIRGEAEVAPTTYENKAEAERADVNVGRLRRTEDRSGSTAADILYELDKAIANEKAEAERIAAREAEAAAAAAAKAGPDISDIIPALEPNAQEKLHEIAEEITEDFSEVRANVTGDVMDFTETETADTAYSEPEQEHTYYNEPRAHETAADIIREDAAEDTVVFTPVGHHHEEAPPPAAEKWAEPVMRAAAEGMTTEKSHKKKKKKKKTFAQKLRGLFPEKGDSVLECVRKIVFLGSVIAIFVCGYLVGDYYYELWASKHKTENIMEIYDIYDGREAATVAVEEESNQIVAFAVERREEIDEQAQHDGSQEELLIASAKATEHTLEQVHRPREVETCQSAHDAQQDIGWDAVHRESVLQVELKDGTRPGHGEGKSRGRHTRHEQRQEARHGQVDHQHFEHEDKSGNRGFEDARHGSCGSAANE